MNRALKLATKSFGFLSMVGLGLFFIWTNCDYKPDENIANLIKQLPEIEINRTNGYVQIKKRGTNAKVGFIFYPGAKVESDAYLPLLSNLVSQTGVPAFITRPPFKLALFGINDAYKVQKQNPMIEKWYVGGHSMGGSMACMFASNNSEKISGVILLGTYCGSDISKTKLKVISINGTQDGIFPLSKIETSSKELPKSAVFQRIDGMNHAQFGNYGPQTGDLVSLIQDDNAKSQVIQILFQFFTQDSK